MRHFTQDVSAAPRSHTAFDTDTAAMPSKEKGRRHTVLLALELRDRVSVIRMGNLQGVICVLILSGCCRVLAEQKPSLKYVPPENISAAKGPDMFRAYCAVCHGLDGRGGGPASDSLKKRPADLTQLSRKNGGRFPALHVANVIQGADVVGAHGSRDMPVWGSVFRTLGDNATVKLRIDNLTAYLESLQRQ